MDTTLIYQALEQPALRKAIPIEELERIKAEYPYFTAAHILLAKIYQENNDHRFSDQVQHAAIYAGDRTVLYHYLKQDASPAARLQDTLPAEELRDVSPEARLRDDSPVASLRDEVEGVEDIGEVERDFAVISEDELEIFGEREGEQELELELEEELEQEEELELEQGATTPNPELGTPNPELGTPNPELRTLNPELDELARNILIEAVHSSIEMEVAEKENENESESENESENESESAIDPSTMSFAELMMLRAKKAHYGQDAPPSAGLRDAQPAAELRDTLPAEELRDVSPSASLREEENEENEEEIDTKSYEYLYKLQNGGLPPLGGTDKREKQRNLIDRFIQTEPKITPGKAAEYSTSANVGKDSLEEDFSFATETMAKLFVQQGKLDKARKVYRKLMELHPEKSVYFATQLKNLNQFKK